MNTKIIAFYLPQFHEIPENNDAWGEGFTEWTNVKKARPLYRGHNQPRVPLNENYYNLLDADIMVRQMNLARKYGIYGFCFYHYWFKGKKVLEKPLEMMLKNEAANLPYCFAWANEAWTKTWHGAKGAKEVLIRQTYGTKKDWEEHYLYLCQFFKDENYIKRDNKPVLLIYKINNMRHRSEMFECFNELAQKDGFDGIFIVQMLSNEDPKSNLKWIEGYVDFEPAHIRNQIRKTGDKKYERRAELAKKFPNWNWWNRFICDIFDYKKINETLLNLRHSKNHFRGMFVDYDDSPRRGKSALIFKNSTPERFGYYLREHIKRARAEGNELIFINAWNEWGESNYLEPDMHNQYAYLNEIKDIVMGKRGIYSE